jgi:hypothetical protein
LAEEVNWIKATELHYTMRLHHTMRLHYTTRLHHTMRFFFCQAQHETIAAICVWWRVIRLFG